MIQYHWKGRRYNVVAGTYGNYVDLHPIYGDKCSIKHSMPDDERYYKESFNGTLKFVRDDYKWVMSTYGATRFNTIYELELWTQTQKVTTLKFVITDCEVDEDNGIITVKPTTKTVYDDVLNGLDREFNLVELLPVVNHVNWQKRGVVQITTADDENVTNHLGTTYWEQIKLNTDGDMETDYQFAVCDKIARVKIKELSEYSIGWYTGVYDPDNSFDASKDTTNVLLPYQYKIQFTKDGNYDYRIDVVRKLGNVEDVIARSGVSVRFNHNVDNINLYADGQIVGVCDFVYYDVFARYLCDTEYINGIQTIVRPKDDIVSYTTNYRYVYPFTTSVLSISNRNTSEPTQYGFSINQLGQKRYYQPPEDNGLYKPIMQETWSEFISYWIDLSKLPSDTVAQKTMTLHHAYPLASVISVLLAQIAPDVIFSATTDYSVFLYSNTNPVTAEDNLHLFITPKTNIINGDYSTPAYNAPIRLKDILDMLKAVYKCYWYIDTSNSSNKLRIEHVSWFMNGGTYSTPSQVISYDLTALRNTRNNKVWAFDKNKYTFDKPNMPATYTFAWMDEVTQEFKGYQMEMTSQLVEKGKNEEINVGKFTSDIDFVTITPDDINKDGFMLLAAQYDDVKDIYSLPFLPWRIENTNVINYLQNGWLSYVYLEMGINGRRPIWMYDLPASSVVFADGSRESVRQQSRMKKQNVTVPMTTPIFDPITLIKTNMGKGEIQDIEINLSSLTGKATLKYDTQ